MRRVQEGVRRWGDNWGESVWHERVRGTLIILSKQGANQRGNDGGVGEQKQKDGRRLYLNVCFLAVSRIWVLRETQHICNRGGGAVQKGTDEGWRIEVMRLWCGAKRVTVCRYVLAFVSKIRKAAPSGSQRGKKRSEEREEWRECRWWREELRFRRSTEKCMSCLLSEVEVLRV